MREPSFVVILSGPSGVGKTSFCKRLIGREPNLVYSVSTTTRPRRPGEVEGVDYHFVDDEEFDRLIENDGFLEWALVHGHRYGTPAAFVEESLSQGRIVLLDVDVQGGGKLMKLYPDGVSVFLLPPSLDVLAERLRGRGTEDEDMVARRVERAGEEMDQVGNYTYQVTNDNLDEGVEYLRAIISAERCRVSRRCPTGG